MTRKTSDERHHLAPLQRVLGTVSWTVLLAIAAAGCTTPDTSVEATAPEPTGGESRASGQEASQTGWRSTPPPEDFDPSATVRAGFLIVDGVYNSELMAPYDILHHTVFHTEPDPGIEVFTVSPDGQAVTTFEGLRIEAHYGFSNAPPIDVLIVPSAEHSMDSDLENPELIEWVRRIGGQARFVLSLCDGAFVLAEAGLLDGRAATTFPGDQDHFAEMFPQIDLRRGTSFVHDGPAITSEGGALSYDPAMYLVDHLYGRRVAAGVGGGLLIPWPPEPERFRATIIEARR